MALSQPAEARTSVRNDVYRYDPVMRAHGVVVLGFDGMAPFELGVAAEVFALPRPELDAEWWYSFTLCGERPGRLGALGGFSLDVAHGLEALAGADTIILPGTADVHSDPAADVLDELRRAHARGARLVSICSGAFVLAATGLLDGLPAATHWRYASLLQERFPRVHVDRDVLYLDNDQILTSAGTAAGIDLCLHIVRRDHGADIANRVARRMVIAPHRDGGQAQFIGRSVAAAVDDDPIGSAITYALTRIDQQLEVDSLARVAHLSPRQFSRRFLAATGTSPGQWLTQQRIDASLPMLERDLSGIESIAQAVGFTPANYRKHFRAQIGVSPLAYRREFQRRGTHGPGET
jgi:AraC family transcriptional regulator, transcriptional activator FtrA